MKSGPRTRNNGAPRGAPAGSKQPSALRGTASRKVPLDVVELTRKAEALEAEMGARAELEVELKDHMAQLAEVDRRKDEFLATLAHELRNPLAPIKMAAMLARSNCGCGGSDRYLEMIERQADNLTRIVDDLVEVSRLTRGTIELRRERVALATVVTRALDSVRAQLEQRRHAVVVRLPDDPVTVMADPVRLEQVLQNILLNAARYTPPGGNIAIVVEVRGSLAEIRVRDDGIGIPAEDLSRVFDLFRQLPDGASGLPSGLGIGLTMARALVELHGGTIDASSSGPGMGSEFVIRLPLPASVPAAESVIPPPLEPAATRHRRVLVVDDNADAGEALEELLRTSGHVVRRVRDGRSALRAVQEFRPDVVLLDLAMPRMDGYEVARRIRTRHPRVRVVAVTGYSQPQHHRRAAESGITDLLVKPVRIDALQRLLDGAALHSGPNLENPPTHDPVSGPTGRAAV